MSGNNSAAFIALVKTSCVCVTGIFLISCTNDVSGPDRPPVAKAGMDVSAPVGREITLDGSGSFDPDGTAIDSYAWLLKSGPQDTKTGIVDADKPTTTFTPDLPGTYVVSLVVTSAGMVSSPDVVRVTADGCLSDEDCDDDDVCNGIETCKDGHCEQGTALDCDDGEQCTNESCDPVDGCLVQNVEDGTECDEQFCQENNIAIHTCLSGECTQSKIIEVCDDGNTCSDDRCDLEQGGCVHTNNTSSCDDGDPCSNLDQCIDGSCTAGTINKDSDNDGFIDAACSGGNDCNDDQESINPGSFEGPQDSEVCSDGIDNDCDGATDETDSGCGHCDQDSDCDDGNTCNGQETCSGHRCMAGTSLDCADSYECTQDRCDPQTGCVHTNVQDGTECGQRSCEDSTWMKQTCISGRCTGSAVEQECNDNNECTNDLCDSTQGCTNSPSPNGTECGSRTCDNLLFNKQVCQNGNCTGNQLIQDCDLGQECQIYSCDPDSGCESSPAADDTDCGSTFCTGTVFNRHFCQSGACTGEQAIEDCDEGVECTNYFCDDSNGCSSSPNTGDTCGSFECVGLEWTSHFCQNGSCTGDQVISDCNDGNICTDDSCDSDSGCANPPSPGTQCEDDSVDCTIDICDNTGACTHQEDDSACPSGELCRPTCFQNQSGNCEIPPGSMDLSCDTPVDLSTVSNSDCTITLTDGTTTGQAPCLECRAELKVVTLDYSDFTDDNDSNSCSLDDWTLRTGNHCYVDADQCNMGGNINAECCSSLTCTISGGPNDSQHAMVFNRADCSGIRKWHILKRFDTSGLTDLELCFDYSSRDATNNEVVQVDVNDASGNNNAHLYCDTEGPRKDVDNKWYRQCVALPAWAQDNQQVVVHFYINSNDNNDIIYLDNINMRGLSAHCPATRETVFHEDFAGCEDPMSDWNGWTVTNTINSLSCDTDWDCYDSSSRAIASGAAGTFSRIVDLTDYHDVMLCFFYGEDGAGPAENLVVQYDLGFGGGWKTIWFQQGQAGPDKSCGEICANLSDLNPSVNRNPHLGLRFSMTSGGKVVELDEIKIRASKYCDGQNVISFTPQPGVLPDGNYSYSAVDLFTSMQLSADFFCSWDSPPEGSEVQDDTSVDYLFPMP